MRSAHWSTSAVGALKLRRLHYARMTKLRHIAIGNLHARAVPDEATCGTGLGVKQSMRVEVTTRPGFFSSGIAAPEVASTVETSDFTPAFVMEGT